MNDECTKNEEYRTTTKKKTEPTEGGQVFPKPWILQMQRCLGTRLGYVVATSNASCGISGINGRFTNRCSVTNSYPQNSERMFWRGQMVRLSSSLSNPKMHYVGNPQTVFFIGHGKCNMLDFKYSGIL
ncbi:uncharacterized protein LOC131313155 isoform X2 [Rhododendron vialii]|uniref:uncharacterized protein LOC131313155 isoform X2 n=1 Tax=Rhododendron vialii TaxID=182163 RepID=UPI00265E5DDC|nr:uncharacterized protein LOC131313155 isoform X2 [Rhododendron vialii]